MEWMLLGKAVFALLFVCSLIALAALTAKRYRLPERFLGSSASGRLAVKESLMLDGRRRLVIVARDGAEHLLLLSPQGDVVVETEIGKQKSEIG